MADTYSRRLDQLRTLLREAAGRPVSYSELMGRGIDNPAQAVYELELEGEQLVHVAGGVALPSAAPRQWGRDGRRRLPLWWHSEL